MVKTKGDKQVSIVHLTFPKLQELTGIEDASVLGAILDHLHILKIIDNTYKFDPNTHSNTSLDLHY